MYDNKFTNTRENKKSLDNSKDFFIGLFTDKQPLSAYLPILL